MKSFKQYTNLKEGYNEGIIKILRELGVDAYFQHKKLYIPKGKMKKVKNLFSMMMSTSNFRPPVLVGESVKERQG